MRIDRVLEDGIKALRESGATDSAVLDTEIILANTLKKESVYLLTHPEHIVMDGELEQFHRLIGLRKQGIPIAYLLGKKEFWSLTFKVNEHVLIPRPETELLVERALTRCTNEKNHVLDLGTGSGIIAIALAHELPYSSIVAVDQSIEALTVAKENQKGLGVDNVSIKQSDWFSNIGNRKFDVIVSNPPYIEPLDEHLTGEVRFEPQAALVAAENGFADLQCIIVNAADYLADNGWLLVEHGFQQGEAVRNFFQQSGFKSIVTHEDLAGNDRVTEGCFAGC